MPKTSYRIGRVEELLHRELSLLIQNDIADPRVRGVTLTAVKISPDLRQARIYFTAVDETQIKKIEQALNHAVSFLRRNIAKKIQLRLVPELVFMYDAALKNAEHLTDVLNALPSDSHKE